MTLHEFADRGGERRKKKEAGMPSLPHPLHQQASKVKVCRHSSPRSAPPKNISIVMTRSLFSISVNPPTPSIPRSRFLQTSGWGRASNRCLHQRLAGANSFHPLVTPPLHPIRPWCHQWSHKDFAGWGWGGVGEPELKTDYRAVIITKMLP